jgi:hypothetical protein
MKVKYCDVVKTLLAEFPEFIVVDEEDLELPYIVAELFTDYLLKAYQTRDEVIYMKGLNFIEKLHEDDCHEVRELATIGYLESIQNTWPESLIRANIPFCDLGKQSKIYWEKLNDFWLNLKGN